MNFDLLRLSMALDSKAQNTIDKYLCNLVEEVIFETQDKKVDLGFLSNSIKEKYNLEFDISEIETAIIRKGKSTIHKHEDSSYSLYPKRIAILSQEISLDTQLSNLIDIFVLSHHIIIEKSELIELIKKYLYFSLNSSISNLLSLISKDTKQVSIDLFPASNDEIVHLNEFISWDNDEKNKLFYTIVSFSYEYCMLATKKNNLLSKDIFKGKRFYLDSNLIFRMAGINKADRKFVMDSFLRKCKEVDIELFYTNETLAEITRVISANIIYIRSITQGQEPLSHNIIETIDDNDALNDFYEIYEGWCSSGQNNFNDFISFQKYLNDLVFNVLTNLKSISIPNYKMEANKSIFENHCNDLKQFKDIKRPRRLASKESVKNDMNNIFYVLANRKKYTSDNIFQTNDFFVSADQILIAWSKQRLSGVPVVVIPSVWLSIILRLTGRSSDDYRSFCLFLTLRQHNSKGDDKIIDLKVLLPALSKKTTRKELKEAIVMELVSNCDLYSFEDEESYNLSIDRAFDTIIEKMDIDNKDKIAQEVEKSSQNLVLLEGRMKEDLENNSLETISGIARKIISRKFERWEKVRNLKMLICGVLILLSISGIYILYIYSTYFKNNISIFAIFLTILLPASWFAISEGINYLSSTKRYDKLLNKKIKELNILDHN